MTRRPLASDLQGPFQPADLGLDLNADAFPEARFDPDVFDQLLRARGVSCLYRPALHCPCARIETRGPRAGCPICDGQGYAYPAELQSPVVVLMPSRSGTRDRTPAGSLVAGGATVTFPPGIIPTVGDQLFPDNEEHVVNQLLRRAMMQIDPAVARARETAPGQQAPVIKPITERLLYPDATLIEAVTWLEDERLSTERLCFARLGRDYIRTDQIITWREGVGPKAGNTFSVRYRAPAAYQVGPLVEPTDRTQESNFPYRCDVIRLDQIGKPDARA